MTHESATSAIPPAGNLEATGDAPTAQERFTRLLREQVAPALRTHGFRGSGQTFELRDERAWALLGFQRSRYSHAGALEFTITALVISKDGWDRLRESNPRLGRRPTPSDARHAGTLRIDEIDETFPDPWWTVTPATGPEPLASNILAAVTGTVLPWMTARLGRTGPSSTSPEPVGDLLV